MKLKITLDTDEYQNMLKEYPLKKSELRKVLIKSVRRLYNKEQSVVGSGWGIRTGRLSREGVIMRVDKKAEQKGGAAYSISFSKKKGKRGTPEYMADTFKARWLEGGTKPHYTVKGATIKKAKKGKLALNKRQRKLYHPGFQGRPIIQNLIESERDNVINEVRNDINKILKSKGADV
ncbi:hypothetical protein [Dickeya phage Sucellus]|nr:hypothetical protein [Dickeya phage Sucellus]